MKHDIFIATILVRRAVYILIPGTYSQKLSNLQSEFYIVNIPEYSVLRICIRQRQSIASFIQ